MDEFKKIAVLIDADNTQYSKLEDMLYEVSTYGRIVVKKAYGNWKKQGLSKWEDQIKRLAIKAEQQFDYVAGKNTTDIAMVIDAMDMLHTGSYDAVALVSSDSDFTPLAVRLREEGVFVIGVGEKKTPEAFTNACDDFIFLEYLSSNDSKEKRDTRSDRQQDAFEEYTSNEYYPDLEDVHSLLRIAYEKYQDDDGFVNVSAAGTYIKRVKPEFTPYAYGFSKLSELIKAFPKKYEVHKSKASGKGAVVTYKCIER